MKIRPAKIKDAKAIHTLVNYYAQKREMLARPLSEIYENIQEFVVAEEKSRVVGCCALHVSWEDLAEVKALAVDEKYQKKGVGKKLVQACHKISGKLGIKKIFALTFKPKFFLKLKYYKISRNKLPHKVWGECIRCPFFPDCGEVPLMIEIK
ncbi:MAG: N-acetyltransferase [Endomicrobiales bacterium]|nr:N-acetyltransferase [Endomicrobiales bacterium]